ncbi:hypothetical protein RB195_014360 [Necator americanus]|uniref:WAP domain-containing protein n=1 Tax=Necator americanus TaxID=51031 RepID=A0ABR1DZV6_NECAM
MAPRAQQVKALRIKLKQKNIVHLEQTYTDEYCPNGWRVHRKPNYDPTTCDPMSTTKCGKPYQCVHAQCGLNFCCAHHRTLREWKEQNELEHEMEEYDDRSEL